MSAKSRLHGALTVGLIGAVAYLGLSRRSLEQGVPGPNRDPVAVRAQPEATANVVPQHSPSAEAALASLRLAIVSQALNAQPPAPPLTEEQAPTSLARAALDERMMSGPPNPSEAARLESVLRPLLTPALLGEAVAELRCGASVCKISLIAEDDARVIRAATALSERAPKAFTAAVVYPEESGHRSVYLSTNATDLQTYEPVKEAAQNEYQRPR